MSYEIRDGVGDEIPAGNTTLESMKKLYVFQDAEEMEMKNFELVASYNWTNEKKFPTLLVPGAPNIWSPKSLPNRVPQDSGKVFVDQNKDRLPHCPIEPLIRVVNLISPEFDLSSVDIVTDRNNLRKIYRWITDSSDLKEFRIDAELAGNTVLFTRWDEKSHDFIRGFRGFGHEFEKSNTRFAPGCEKSTGHHRIVSYNLGDIKLLVRFEVDGCFALTPDAKEKTRTVPGEGKPAAAVDVDSEDLVDTLAGLQISGQPIPFDSKKTKLHYILNGLLVSQSEIMELKTRVKHKDLDWDENWPQLYFSQTRFLMLAKHFRGEFVMIEKNDLNSKHLNSYVRRGNAELIRMRSALETMKALVVKHGKGNHGLSFVYAFGKLKVFLRNGSGNITKVDPSLLELFSNSKSTTGAVVGEAAGGDAPEKKVNG